LPAALAAFTLPGRSSTGTIFLRTDVMSAPAVIAKLPGPEPFDIAAAGLIVEKAGGKVTDMQGNPWSPFSESIVATNGLIHEALLEVLNK
jgi:fructose-1,6-bisphosphatase/inositol monophosphatase family enzyme